VEGTTSPASLAGAGTARQADSNAKLGAQGCHQGPLVWLSGAVQSRQKHLPAQKVADLCAVQEVYSRKLAATLRKRGELTQQLAAATQQHEAGRLDVVHYLGGWGLWQRGGCGPGGGWAAAAGQLAGSWLCTVSGGQQLGHQQGGRAGNAANWWSSMLNPVLWARLPTPPALPRCAEDTSLSVALLKRLEKNLSAQQTSQAELAWAVRVQLDGAQIATLFLHSYPHW